VSGIPLSTEERWRRYQRDLEAYRRISLVRRSHARFRDDLNIVPRVFLLRGKARIARLEQPREAVLDALRGQVVWTLDTAVRLVGMKGFLTAADLTGYMAEETLRQAEQKGWISPPREAGLSLDPLYSRPLSLVAHLVDSLPSSTLLPSGDLVVPWGDLKRDLLGTLGWRPDLLTRLERDYPAMLAGR
jgi:hypothetical protein